MNYQKLIKQSNRKKLEDEFFFQIKINKLKIPVREYRFDSSRRWRFDFAYSDRKIGIEVQGGIWIKGGHNTGKGIEKDYEKLNNALLQGWKVLLFTGGHIKSGIAIEFVKQILAQSDFINKK